ncbi:hypothetical protein Ato02nite_052190 [Paractinoplanes toevensis]|uniref:Uncharacterized protein n=1 Tax=Paractinoplanes toevensis TaxID=571911 RepID=A0A919W8E4_9ACTN|nr:hypothetical protein Ato02nite_052190 [Actinoplanes toevensis]
MVACAYASSCNPVTSHALATSMIQRSRDEKGATTRSFVEARQGKARDNLHSRGSMIRQLAVHHAARVIGREKFV